MTTTRRTPKLDDIAKGHIQADLECGMPPKAIAEASGYSRKHIERMRRNLRQCGSVTKPKLSKLGAPRRLTAAMTEVRVHRLEM